MRLFGLRGLDARRCDAHERTRETENMGVLEHPRRRALRRRQGTDPPLVLCHVAAVPLFSARCADSRLRSVGRRRSPFDVRTHREGRDVGCGQYGFGADGGVDAGKSSARTFRSRALCLRPGGSGSGANGCFPWSAGWRLRPEAGSAWPPRRCSSTPRWNDRVFSPNRKTNPASPKEAGFCLSGRGITLPVFGRCRRRNRSTLCIFRNGRSRFSAFRPAGVLFHCARIA